MGNLRVDMIYLYPRLPVERYYKSLCDLKVFVISLMLQAVLFFLRRLFLRISLLTEPQRVTHQVKCLFSHHVGIKEVLETFIPSPECVFNHCTVSCEHTPESKSPLP